MVDPIHATWFYVRFYAHRIGPTAVRPVGFWVPLGGPERRPAAPAIPQKKDRRRRHEGGELWLPPRPHGPGVRPEAAASTSARTRRAGRPGTRAGTSTA